MFLTIRKNTNLLEVLAHDLQRSIIESGTDTYRFEDDKEVGCPFCGHKDCFKMFFKEDLKEDASYHCFSCGAHGDVISWRQHHLSQSPREALEGLAKDVGISLKWNYSPVQEVMDLAAAYYENCMWDSCNKPFGILGDRTPVQYQNEVRHHDDLVLRNYHIGWSDGNFVSYMESIGFSSEILNESGLRRERDGRVWDFMPRNCFVYPHYVKGKVSHFTFKDPLKKTEFQLNNKFKLNGIEFYGQDSISRGDFVYLVEGENDLLSLATSSNAPVLATIGQISASQIKWLQANCENKTLVTIFDPDEAGDKYRAKLAKVRNSFRDLIQIKNPEGTDIDDFLKGGGDLTRLLEVGVVQPDVEPLPVQIVPKAPTGEELLARMGTDDEVSLEEGEDPPIPDKVENNTVIQRNRAYYKITFKDSEPIYKRISNFIINLKNIYIDDEGERHREIEIVRSDGKKSKPILVNSDAKTSLRAFRVLVARAVDADFTGNEIDLSGVWELVYNLHSETQVMVTHIVGYDPNINSWMFQNRAITSSGRLITPDEDGILWVDGKSLGIRPKSLYAAGSKSMSGNTTIGSGIPFLEADVSPEEADDLLKKVIENLAKNLNNPGAALLLIGWIYSCVYSNTIFSLNQSFPFLFFWGTKGKGKTAIAKWLLDFFDMRDSGFTSVPQLRSGVGWERKVAYYASLPVAIDEVRSDRETQEYYGVFRSFYDRTARTLGSKDSSHSVDIRPVRSCFMFIGEDQFEDPALRERCLPIRIPVNNRELVESYRWMGDHKHLFTGITFNWILESCRVDHEDIKAEIRKLDKELIEKAGTSQRTSKNWAAVGFFAIRLAKAYMPEFDMVKYLFEESKGEAAFQQSDTTVSQFFDLAEGIAAQENSGINSNHVMLKDNELFIWFSPLFSEVMKESRGKIQFSKHALLQAIREEPYFLSEGKKIPMGIHGQRRSVISLDYEKAPDYIKNLAPPI